MTASRAGGPPAYRAAHKIAVVDGRMSFELAYCLTTLVFEHAGGPIEPQRNGNLSLKLCKQLAQLDLVLLTAQVISPTRAVVRLTTTPAMLDEMVDIPEPTIVVRFYDAERRRKKANWYVEVAQAGLGLVTNAVEPTDD